MGSLLSCGKNLFDHRQSIALECPSRVKLVCFASPPPASTLEGRAHSTSPHQTRAPRRRRTASNVSPEPTRVTAPHTHNTPPTPPTPLPGSPTPARSAPVARPSLAASPIHGWNGEGQQFATRSPGAEEKFARQTSTVENLGRNSIDVEIDFVAVMQW